MSILFAISVDIGQIMSMVLLSLRDATPIDSFQLFTYSATSSYNGNGNDGWDVMVMGSNKIVYVYCGYDAPLASTDECRAPTAPTSSRGCTETLPLLVGEYTLPVGS